MLTPCIYKRGLIWLLFFVLSLFVVPHFSDGALHPTNEAKTVKAQQYQQQQLVPQMEGR